MRRNLSSRSPSLLSLLSLLSLSLSLSLPPPPTLPPSPPRPPLVFVPQASALNPHLLINRYGAGGHFTPHADGSTEVKSSYILSPSRPLYFEDSFYS